MKHLGTVSRTSPQLAALPLEVKLNGALDIIDRLLLAQRQAPWKTPFPIDNNADDSNTDTNTDTDVLI